MNKGNVLTREEVEQNIAQANHSQRTFTAQSLMTPPPQPIEIIQPKIEEAKNESKFWKNVLNS
jgi:hypothetical protein